MAKICVECGFQTPEEWMPIEEKEDCPKCGGKGTLEDEESELLEQGEENNG